MRETVCNKRLANLENLLFCEMQARILDFARSKQSDGQKMKTFFLLKIFLIVFLFSEVCYAETGQASFYGKEACKFNPIKSCPTADGSSLYSLEANGIPYAAMWDVPFGTWLRVCNQRTRQCTDVVVKDRGPSKRFVPRRIIDLNRRSFAKISNPDAGLVNVTVERLSK
jgi:rare lipoprotein A (peptidoglycan hydrolase)